MIFETNRLTQMTSAIQHQYNAIHAHLSKGAPLYFINSNSVFANRKIKAVRSSSHQALIKTSDFLSQNGQKLTVKALEVLRGDFQSASKKAKQSERFLSSGIIGFFVKHFLPSLCARIKARVESLKKLEDLVEKILKIKAQKPAPIVPKKALPQEKQETTVQQIVVQEVKPTSVPTKIISVTAPIAPPTLAAARPFIPPPPSENNPLPLMGAPPPPPPAPKKPLQKNNRPSGDGPMSPPRSPFKAENIQFLLENEPEPLKFKSKVPSGLSKEDATAQNVLIEPYIKGLEEAIKQVQAKIDRKPVLNDQIQGEEARILALTEPLVKYNSFIEKLKQAQREEVLCWLWLPPTKDNDQQIRIEFVPGNTTKLDSLQKSLNEAINDLTKLIAEQEASIISAEKDLEKLKKEYTELVTTLYKGMDLEQLKVVLKGKNTLLREWKRALQNRIEVINGGKKQREIKAKPIVKSSLSQPLEIAKNKGTSDFYSKLVLHRKEETQK